MGCISSKLLVKSGSFSESVNQSFQKRSNVIEELLISNSKNKADQQQFLALLCSTNTLTQNPKSNSETNGSDQNPKPIEPNTDLNSSLDLTKIETINTWELLAGLEEEQEEEKDQKENEHEKQEQEQNKMDDDEKKTEDEVEKERSFRTVEDLNEILTFSASEDSNNTVTGTETGTSSSSSSTGMKRRARAKELAELKLPSFEFAKSGSLRDWLSKGGPIFSPGSYITPKFGSDQKEGLVIGKNRDEIMGNNNEEVFDPEMLAQFEEAIEEMRKEEESILREIVDGLDLDFDLDLEEGISVNNGEKKRLSMILEKDFIELKGRDITLVMD